MRLATILFLVSVLAAGGCAPRNVLHLVPGADRVGQSVEIFSTSVRGRDADGAFVVDRDDVPSHSRYVVTAPPMRRAGAMPTARWEAPDPAEHFVVADVAPFADRAAFRERLGAALAEDPDRGAVIFVHGFNNSFADGLYRQAQITLDLQIPGVPVYFSWPSAANPLGYNHDRDSVLFSRTPLEELIRDVEAAGAENIAIVAHSMGALLTVEALRQMAIRDGGSPSVDLDGVVLIAPDVDVELFRQIAGEIGALPEPFAIFVSQRDPALLLSALLTGEEGRLGNLGDPSRLADLPVTIVDVTEFTSSAENRHFTAGTSPALIRILGQVGRIDTAFAGDRAGNPGLIPGTVIGLQRATQVVLSPALMLQ